MPRTGDANERLEKITPEAISYVMSAIGSKGGQARTERKAAAARANAIKARAKRWSLRRPQGSEQPSAL